jgi:hypothetical protein
MPGGLISPTSDDGAVAGSEEVDFDVGCRVIGLDYQQSSRYY